MRGFEALAVPAAAAQAHVAAACADPERAQDAVLARIVDALRTTPFGRDHGFDHVRDYDGFVARVPLRDYDALEPWLSGERADLAALCCFEPTSGSSGAAKLIPYTGAFLAELRTSVLAWLGGTLARHPRCAAGRAYWTLSPLTRAGQATHRGVRVGLASDLAYLGPGAEALAEGLVAPALTGDWRVATLRALLAAPDLAWLSLWSPTFFLALLDDACVDALPAAERARVVAAKAAGDLTPLWPELSLVSCWADAASAPAARALAALFPGAQLEAKGLLATEGIVSLPWAGAPAGVLALASHFLEFIDHDLRVWRAHELTFGEEYEVVLTTSAGLVRYRLGDRVRVCGWHRAAPCVEFVARTSVVDLCGEKLSEAFVAAALDRVRQVLPVAGSVVLHPDAAGRGYIALADVPAAEAARLQWLLETQLAANPHYAYARNAGQLRPLIVASLRGLDLRLHRWLEGRGRRAGDAKARVLLGTHPEGLLEEAA